MRNIAIYALLALCAVAPIVALVSTIKASHGASVARIERNLAMDELSLSMSNLSRETEAMGREATNAMQSSSELVHVLMDSLTNRPAAGYDSYMIIRSDVTLESEYEPTVTRTTNGWEITFKE